MSRNWKPSVILLAYKLDKVTHATVDVIGRCQNSCVFCYNDPYLRASRIEFEKFKEIVKSLPSLEKIGIGGGEPFLHFNIVDMIALCIEKGLRVNVSSNGIFIPDDALDLIRNGKITLQIHLPAADNSSYNSITRNANVFQEILRNLGSLRGLPNVQARMTLCNENVGQLRPVAELAHSFGFPLDVSLFVPFLWNSATKLDRKAVDDAHFLITVLRMEGKQISASWGRENTSCPRVAQAYGLTLEKGRCNTEIENKIYIMPDGKMKGCEFLDG